MSALTARRGSWMGVAVALALIAALLAANPPAAQSADEVQLKFKVTYKNGGANLPLAGVEVTAMQGGGTFFESRCTNAKGLVVFRVEPGDNFYAAVQYAPWSSCSNALLTNPANGKKMLAASNNGNHGLDKYDPFTVPPGGLRVAYKLRTPPTRHKQRQICAGYWSNVWGTPGDDILSGTTGNDIINGAGGNDIIRGLAGNDLLCGGPGPDLLIGNGGHDFLLGEGGHDKPLKAGGVVIVPGGLKGGKGNDSAYGGPGSDKCKAETTVDC